MTPLEWLHLVLDNCKQTVGSDPWIQTEELDKTIAWLARAVEVLADAKRSYNEKFVEVLKAQNQTLRWSALERIVKGICSDEQYLVDLADGTNRLLSKRVHELQTLISFNKAQLLPAITKHGDEERERSMPPESRRDDDSVF